MRETVDGRERLTVWRTAMLRRVRRERDRVWWCGMVYALQHGRMCVCVCRIEMI